VGALAANADLFAGISYSRPLRRYQRLALDAFERNRSGGGTRAYLVLPPGAGKTVLGLEIARRMGRKTLILCPNTAVQAQWLQQWQDFQPSTVPCGATRDLATSITVLTYAALCNLDRDSAYQEDGALALWRQVVEAELDLPPERAEAEIERIATTQRYNWRIYC
jgi:superfamily II DNA or RNA helicase